MKNPITLVVIDPQVDFVSGSLAVSSAHEAMNYLAQWGDRECRFHERSAPF